MKKIVIGLGLILLNSMPTYASDISDILTKNFMHYCVNNNFDKTKIETLAKHNNLPTISKEQKTPDGAFVYFPNKNIILAYIHGECMIAEDNVAFEEVKNSLEKQFKINDIHYEAVSPNAQYIVFMPDGKPAAVFVKQNNAGRTIIDGKNITHSQLLE